jgi:hypothetical protein
MERKVLPAAARGKQSRGLPGVNKRALAGVFGLIPRLGEEGQRLEALIRWAAAPVVAGIKPASLAALPQGLGGDAWETGGPEICRRLGISALTLRRGPKRVLALFFRRGQLIRRALRGVPGRYLRSLAYPVDSGPAACLARLGERFSEAEGGGSFPHEVGIFLGYPPEDVISFSSGKTSPYPCRGYWQVYHRPERALRTFAYMDAARLRLVEEYYGLQLRPRDRAPPPTSLGGSRLLGW